MIDEWNFFDQPVKNDLTTYDNIRKFAIGQRDDCTTGCWLDYNYLNSFYKMIEIDLSKQQEFDANLKAIQQCIFKENLNRSKNVNKNTIMFFFIEEGKETILDFSKETVKVLQCCFNIISI